LTRTFASAHTYQVAAALSPTVAPAAVTPTNSLRVIDGDEYAVRPSEREHIMFACGNELCAHPDTYL
jgi:hypothetical protein